MTVCLDMLTDYPAFCVLIVSAELPALLTLVSDVPRHQRFDVFHGLGIG
jgi:hypothetical protein